MVKVAAALAQRALPIRPGDMVRFSVSWTNMLIVYASEQVSGDWGTGQRIAGILCSRRESKWEEFNMVWSGYNHMWTIVRQ